ncbi:MAG: sortase [Anaerolineales bacterium]|nr:sortase [Anaerolineales bacterium]
MNTKTGNKSLLYRVAAIFMIVMMLLAAMPASLVQAAPLRAVGVGADFGAANVAQGTGAMTAITGTYTVGAGANRLLVVAVLYESQGANQTSTFTSGSYGGQALTSLTLNGSGVPRNRVWVGYLKEAGIAAAASTTLNLNFANSVNPNGWVVKAAWFNGIDQTTPINAFVNGGNENPGSATHNFGGNLAVINGGRAIYFEATNQDVTYTAPAGYTENFDANYATNNFRGTAGSKAIVANGNENPNIVQNGAQRYIVTAISLNPVPAVPVAPAITSANATTFTAGVAGNFTATATGTPAPTFAVTTGTLPGGITLSTAGVLSGTPAAGTVGAFPITITASNGTLPNATQNFTLTVQKANTTTTINSDTPDPSLAGQNVVVNYTVASAGNAIARTGNVTVSDGVNNCVGTAAAGTCTLALATVGARTLTATYAGDANFNGSVSAGSAHTVTASFIITASAGAGGTITPTGAVAVAGGANQAFSSAPNATFILSDVLVDGASVGRANSYTFNAVAANRTIASSFNGGWSAPTAAVVTGGTGINQNNALSSNNTNAVFDSLSDVVSYTTFGIPAIPAGATINGIEVAIEGYYSPAPARNAQVFLSWNNGANFTAFKNSNLLVTESTVILGGVADTWGRSWTNTEFTNGNFIVRVTNTGGAGGPVNIDQLQVKVTYTLAAVAPVITSAVPTVSGTVGIAYNHTYTATGTAPITYSLLAGGTLPPGLTLSAGGVLSGTPTTVGTYTGTVRASNGTLPNSDQAFSITINSAPVITSANNASFTLGSLGSFTVTATGSPTPILSMVGSLPAGVTFTPATGILSGTPAAGTGGIYALTFTATNVAGNPSQAFTLTVTEGPSFTSAATTTFSLGISGTFTVTTVGNPAAAISMTGTPPAGVIFVDNGNGTGTLSGTPAAVGSSSLTFTATNGILPNATQTFTLNVKNGPMVGANGINSDPDTGNGSISNNESIVDTLGVDTLIVKFDQDVLNVPVGNLNYGDSVINPANYMLVMGSSTGVFQTVSCFGGVVAPDVSISVDSVSYNNSGGAGPFVATLGVNGGNPLNVVGFYRLYVCGTTSIVDAANPALELAGDGVNPGTDFILNFRIQAVAVVGGGGGAGGGNNTVATTAVAAAKALIPVTGFAPDRITNVPVQPANKAYKSMGGIRIEIPTLGVNYPIVGAMFDTNSWDLTWLKDSVAYLEGSAYPTLAGNTVLTAHVIDSNNNLGPFSDIKGMQSGQKIYIHANGQIYVYQVQENRKIAPSNISAAFEHEENSWITLVTCEDYNAKTGLYKYRRMVRAVLVSVISEK